MSTYYDLFDEGRIALFKLQEGENDARLLLLWACDIDMPQLLTDYTTSQVSEEKIKKYRDAVALRKTGMPLQYITHESNFCGLELYVDENVLIPRFDTEVLVEKVLADNKENDITVLDLCTGSGCIAIALAKFGRYRGVYGSDISRAALEIADANAERNGVDITFYESDMFNELGDLRNLDIIVSNPPYIRSAVFGELMTEVRDHEPRIALDGDEDGLKFYRIIASGAREHLHKGGKLYLEIGYDQAEEVRKLLEENGYRNIEIIKDLSGLDRVICSTV
ncbi:MAG: peptide chain release factor N(5)-glutamine methyltransferase [Lachnospiraceae bacterium]|nr:peptide chain release factor N(5)-glutamine methyltransferase [Lachnospiraceae bacterium]